MRSWISWFAVRNAPGLHRTKKAEKKLTLGKLMNEHFGVIPTRGFRLQPAVGYENKHH